MATRGSKSLLPVGVASPRFAAPCLLLPAFSLPTSAPSIENLCRVLYHISGECACGFLLRLAGLPDELSFMRRRAASQFVSVILEIGSAVFGFGSAVFENGSATGNILDPRGNGGVTPGVRAWRS